MIKVQNLTYRYAERQTPALMNVSFNVNGGEICGFLAPNGGGKTTLFKILATLLPLQEGKLSYNNEDWRNNFAAIRRTIGVVFQSPSVDKKLTVLENINCQAYLYGSTPGKLKNKIDDIINMFGLNNYRDRKLETLSGGYQRRVELAKSMLHDPDILFLDEPGAGLDIGSRRELWQYLKTLRDENNVTTLVTTHLVEEAEQCDRVIILNEGRLVVSGTPVVLKDEIGGEILSLKTRHVDFLINLLREKWNLEGLPVDGIVRVEIRDNRRIINSLLTDHLELIDSVTLSKPSLADVFFKHTGNRFDNEKEEGSH